MEETTKEKAFKRWAELGLTTPVKSSEVQSALDDVINNKVSDNKEVKNLSLIDKIVSHLLFFS